MSTAAILGAGDLGAAIAHALVSRGRIRRVVLIDDARDVATGKALDIQQSCPIDRVDVEVVSTTGNLSATTADVVILADNVRDGAWDAERGLTLVRQLMRAGLTAPIVCAAPGHTELMERAVREGGVAADRIVGTAASAMAGALRGLVALDVGGSGTDVQAVVTGRPPGFVVAWSAATVGGVLVAERLPAHRLLAIAATLKQLWPPGPRAIGAATAQVAEALVAGSRHAHQAATILDGELGLRGAAVMLPLTLGQGRVLTREIPSLSPVEKGHLVSFLRPT